MRAFVVAGRTFGQELRKVSLTESLEKEIDTLRKPVTNEFSSSFDAKKKELGNITAGMTHEQATMVVNSWKTSYDNKVIHVTEQFMKKYRPSLVTFGFSTGLSIFMSFPFAEVCPMITVYSFPMWFTIAYAFQQSNRNLELQNAFKDQSIVDLLCKVNETKN